VVAGQHRPGQIVKIVMAPFTPIFLSRWLGRIVTLLRNVRRPTMGAADPVRPTQLANGFVTLDIVQQILKVDHRRGTWSAAVQNLFSVAPAPVGTSRLQQSGVHIEPPDFVIERLRPMKERLRDGMKELSSEQRDELRAALKKVTADFDSEFNQWNEIFMACFQSTNRKNLAEQILALPEPPPEPPGMWQRLLNQAKQEGSEGVAACLTLYDIGCARAVRQFQKSKNNHVST